MTRAALVLVALALAACGETPAPPPSPEATPPDEGPPEAGPIPEAWVRERVAAAEARMEESEGGRRVAQAIEAHGGLSTWLAHGTIAFDFDYRPRAQPERRMHTRSEVDLWRARARQEELEDDPDDGEEAVFGWDGERAWIAPSPDAFPSTARFWSTTPYYFVGIPFVLADPGARYEVLDDAELDGVAHQLVKVSYEAGTGDSPDDYYVIYLHPESHRVSAIRYIVAFPGFFEPGQHSPEKLMRYEDLREVDGLWLAHGFTTHTWDADAQTIGDAVTDVEAGRYVFGETWPVSRFAPVEGAEVTTEIERRPR